MIQNDTSTLWTHTKTIMLHLIETRTRSSILTLFNSIKRDPGLERVQIDFGIFIEMVEQEKMR